MNLEMFIMPTSLGQCLIAGLETAAMRSDAEVGLVRAITPAASEVPL
jgi:hypothetical protein